jgi:hypothetical protein
LLLVTTIDFNHHRARDVALLAHRDDRRLNLLTVRQPRSSFTIDAGRRKATMSDVQHPLWAKEEAVEATADAAFAFKYWTSVANMVEDPGVERVETDGPYRDRPGMRGTTYLTGGGTTEWVVAEVEPGRRIVIDLALSDATVRFEFRSEERVGGGSVLTQRVSLFGPNAQTYLEGVQAGFATNLRDGMCAIRDRIDRAAAHAQNSGRGQ